MRWIGVLSALVVLILLGQMYVMAQGLSWWPYSFLPQTPQSTVALHQSEHFSEDEKVGLREEDALQEGIALFCREYENGQVMCEIKSGDTAPEDSDPGAPVVLQP